jgi:transcriptional regulator GlxA family with amidase domain
VTEMTNTCHFLPMKHSVLIVVYPGFELLDATGPASVFDNANGFVPEPAGKHYEVQLVSSRGGTVASSCGVAVSTRSLREVTPGEHSTMLVSGAEERHIVAAMRDTDLGGLLAKHCLAAGRFGSICAGSFILAGLGLLDGKQATTHWRGCSELAARFPAVQVNPDALYTIDGNIWTSAGVTSGIDMALAMVCGDLGAAVAGHVARHLVVYQRRPGYQSQFSPMLQAQATGDDTFGELIYWVRENLDTSLDTAALAARAGLSERTFYRRFRAVTGQTPAQLVEGLRLDAVRVFLAQGLPLKTIAGMVGFPSARRLSERFERRFGVSPAFFRDTH